jgi:hypothetical protein
MEKAKLLKKILKIVLSELLFLVPAAIFALFLTALWFSDDSPLFIWIPDARLALSLVLIIYFSAALAGLKLKASILKKLNLDRPVPKFLLVLDLTVVALLISPTFLALIMAFAGSGNKP